MKNSQCKLNPETKNVHRQLLTWFVLYKRSRQREAGKNTLLIAIVISLQIIHVQESDTWQKCFIVNYSIRFCLRRWLSWQVFFFYSLRPRRTGIKKSIQVQLHLNLKSTARTPLANFPYDIIFSSRLAASLETTLLPWPGNRFLSRENGGQILVVCSSPAFCVYCTRFFPGKVYAGKSF